MTVTRFIPAICWFILSLVLLCLPGSSLPRISWFAAIHADKLIHITLFGILCTLFAFPFHKSDQSAGQRKKWFLLILFGGIAYGTAMEFVQKYWVPNRSFEALDIAADSVGSLIAYFYSLKKWSENK